MTTPTRRRDQLLGRDLRRRGRTALLTALLALVPASGWGAGNQVTDCVNLCPANWPNVDPCVVSQDVTVIAGSVIDCGTRAVRLSGGNLIVHDGRFTLKARSLLVANSRTITADCPGGNGYQGFTIQTTDSISVTSGGFKTACPLGGGQVALSADTGSITFTGGFGVNATGTTRGGSISITAGGAVTTAAGVQLQASATGQGAAGEVEIDAGTITLRDQISAQGYVHGGRISLQATGDIVSSGPLLAQAVSSGDGGDVRAVSGGFLRVTKPVKAQGIGATSAGGTVLLQGESVEVNNDVNAAGGYEGGIIDLEARGGRVDVGNTSLGVITLNADGDRGGPGGQVTMLSEGNDVTVYGVARVRANGLTGGYGGSITTTGAKVSVESNAQVLAAGASGRGGTIGVEARDAMKVVGTLKADNGTTELAYRCTKQPCETVPVVGPDVQGTLRADDELDATCGDGVRRLGVEACDSDDLGVDGTGKEQTCQSLSPTQYKGGTLGCTSACQYDTSGCTQ